MVCDRARGRADDGSGAKLHEVLAVFLPIATGDENGLSDPLAVTGGSCLMTALVLWRVSRDRGGCLRRAKFNPTRLGQICFAQGSLLLKTGSRAPRSLLETIGSITDRMCVNRGARVWTYKDRRFFSFPSWKSVRFVDEPELAADRRGDLSVPPEAPAG